MPFGRGRPATGWRHPTRNEYVQDMEPSVRVRRGLWLYLSGACPTKREASMAAGLHPNTLTIMMNGSEPTKRLAATIQERIEDQAEDMSTLMRVVGRKAVSRLLTLMDTSGSERIQLEAARDLADRSPETQKSQRIEVADLTLGGQDAKAIAAALVESARASAAFGDVARDGLVEIQDAVASPVMLPLPAPAPAATPSKPTRESPNHASR